MGQGGGKTWGGSAKLVYLHAHYPGTNSLCIGPTHGNNRQILIPALVERLEQLGIPHDINFGQMEIYTPTLGRSTILLHSGMKGERITGFEVGRTWIDEPSRIPDFAHQPKRDCWFNAIARTRDPRVPAERRQLMTTGTHEGKGTWVYRRWEQNPKPGYVVYRGSTFENPEAREYGRLLIQEYGPELAEQYVRGGAVEDLRSALKYDDIVACQGPDATRERTFEALARLPGRLVWGVDIGRSKSLTVLWALSVRADGRLVTEAVIEMREARFREQADMVAAVCDLPSTVGVCIDATYNPQTAEDAACLFRSIVEPVIFTTANKVEICQGLVTVIQDRTIVLPDGEDAEDIVLDFYSMKRVVTSRGAVTFTAPMTSDGHADRFIAAALGVRAAGQIADDFAYTPGPALRTAGLRRAAV